MFCLYAETAGIFGLTVCFTTILMHLRRGHLHTALIYFVC
ncbi:hypothetical protein [Lacticaseibacillus suilingensis]